jgi:hypothetical protein
MSSWLIIMSLLTAIFVANVPNCKRSIPQRKFGRHCWSCMHPGVEMLNIVRSKTCHPRWFVGFCKEGRNDTSFSFCGCHSGNRQQMYPSVVSFINSCGSRFSPLIQQRCTLGISPTSRVQTFRLCRQCSKNFLRVYPLHCVKCIERCEGADDFEAPQCRLYSATNYASN